MAPAATMRAKMVVNEVVEHFDEDAVAAAKKAKQKLPGPVQTDLALGAVCAEEFGPEGEDGNNTFARYTPHADLLMTIQNPGLHGVFKEGDELYVDFTFCKEYEK